jgi:peroxiredoxin
MPIATNTQAPDFTLPSRGGETVQLSAHSDAPVLLFFFTPNCSWCEVALPRFLEVLRRREDAPVRTIGVVHGESAPLEVFLQDKNIHFPLALDENGETMRAFQIERVPTLILLGIGGVVARVYEGWTEQLPGILEQTLLAMVHTHDILDHPLPEYGQIGNGCAP